MLDSIFIAIFIVALILQIIAIYEKSIIFSVLSIMFWLVLIANALYIEVPYDVAYTAVNGSVVITKGAHVYTEIGLGALFLAFVFFDIVWTIVQYMELRREREIP